MSNTCTWTLSLLMATVSALLPCGLAADFARVNGQIHTAAGELVQGLTVSMEARSTQFRTAPVETRVDGSFGFSDIPIGDYTLRVTDGRGTTIWEQSVDVQVPPQQLDVRLPGRESDHAGPGTAKVSVTELIHPPEKKAVQSFQRALRLSSAGKYEDAVAELQRAISISPQFGAAHTNLGVQYFRLGRIEDSAAEWARAIQIGGPDALNLCNLAAAQARLHRFEEAEKLAREALHMDSGYGEANLILGSILVERPATRGEGMKYLEKAAGEFPSARQYLDQVRGSH